MLENLAGCGRSFEAVSDLCEFAAHRDPRLAELKARAEKEGLTIVACYPRVVKGLFKQSGNELPEEGVSFLNMRSQTAEEIAAVSAFERVEYGGGDPVVELAACGIADP